MSYCRGRPRTLCPLNRLCLPTSIRDLLMPVCLFDDICLQPLVADSHLISSYRDWRPVFVRTAAHQYPSTSGSFIPILNISREAVSCNMTKMEWTVSIWPCHENCNVVHDSSPLARQVRYLCHVRPGVSGARRCGEPNWTFLIASEFPRGIRIG